MSLEYRLVDIETRDPAMIAAIDHVLLRRCDEGTSPPTLIYHNWEKSVSLALAQTSSDINIGMCTELGFKVVRMQSGGRAVVHYPGTEFTYSLFTPLQHEPSTAPAAIYDRYCTAIVKALEELGISAEVKNTYDVFVGEKKIGGNAQRILRNIVMQQGIILHQTPNAQETISLMNPALYDANDVEELRGMLTSVYDHVHVDQEKVREALTKNIFHGHTYTIGTLSREEIAEAEALTPQYSNFQSPSSTSIRGLCWLPRGAPRGPQLPTTLGENIHA